MPHDWCKNHLGMGVQQVGSEEAQTADGVGSLQKIQANLFVEKVFEPTFWFVEENVHPISHAAEFIGEIDDVTTDPAGKLDLSSVRISK